jgi:hypothetical protein
MFKTLFGIQELEDKIEVLENLCLCAMQISPEFRKHIRLSAKDAPYVRSWEPEEVNLRYTLVESISQRYDKDIEQEGGFYLYRTN